jgi:hypothetical protein
MDLTKREIKWRGWFPDLSKKIYDLTCPKMLLLAGIDRLDKELTVRQMQGKFTRLITLNNVLACKVNYLHSNLIDFIKWKGQIFLFCKLRTN